MRKAVFFNYIILELKYESPSPDDTALLEGLESNEIILKMRKKTQAILNVLGVEMQFDILSILPFTSLRKRMSVIVKTSNGISIFRNRKVSKSFPKAPTTSS